MQFFFRTWTIAWKSWLTKLRWWFSWKETHRTQSAALAVSWWRFCRRWKFPLKPSTSWRTRMSGKVNSQYYWANLKTSFLIYFFCNKAKFWNLGLMFKLRDYVFVYLKNYLMGFLLFSKTELKSSESVSQLNWKRCFKCCEFIAQFIDQFWLHRN